LEQEIIRLFDLNRAPIMRYLYSFGLSAQDSEEVIQEVFLALFQHLRKGRPRTNVQGWVFRVAHNLGLKRALAAKREYPVPEHADRMDSALNPEEQIAADQRRRRLLSVVDALPEQDKRCLYLRAEGLRYREITTVLGMSLGAVAQSLERTLARLSRADSHHEAVHKAR